MPTEKQKLDLWLGPWGNLRPLSPCKSEPSKKLKSSRLLIFFKVGIIKNFAIFAGKHLCWDLFLIKLRVYRSAKFSKIDSSTSVCCGYCKIFKNSFLIQHLWWLLLTVLPRYSEASWGACSLISHLQVLSILIKNFHETLLK